MCVGSGERRGEMEIAAPRRLEPRRAAAIREAGRITVAAAPAAAFVLLLSSRGTWEQRVATAAAQAVIWALAVGLAHTLGGAALTALGPRVAVGRGVLLAAVVSIAASVWLPHERHTAAAFVLLPACVFVGGAAWETFSLRWVA